MNPLLQKKEPEVTKVYFESSLEIYQFSSGKVYTHPNQSTIDKILSFFETNLKKKSP